MTFESFPWLSLIGGALLGLSATMLLMINGKVAGISGIVNGLLSPKYNDLLWRLLFVIGMVAGGALSVIVIGVEIPSTESIPTYILIIAGLLVGFGTRLGNGCTSGHGICGVGRFSFRSLVATAIFMMVAAMTVYIR
ncbi:YeeE/YedE family protein [Vibrio neptunius]|uniref:YeeE/YedE family protein n=1 Tax=Vibrio neptunius TaxID=170651 RepID=A0ABS2ZZF1_9VIBR|nr:YeeE/YedE family protein [Vibrio neptunius]MBN3492344.1 YeeE/YedE family protein [Vibrio neptunius]MBN3514841.1 YeeE/YedE family protein [Vibrio neptunius]MBN3549724.1 YeeE/YedE family protein [Vibrio neptunius]MBN3576969.1 YeeE/YedE family protein [Vibrio neptunius]MCH9870633.1 YeeE/YedE family protein [Vibrio neptunius]